MKILHTSDWHLGKTLENRDRLPEQREVLDEVCRIAEARAVDLVLVSGDIFDTYVPPAAAEELFYDAVERLAAGGHRAVVIIAGNHDSPDRLCAARPLADRNGIILLGLPGSQAGLTATAAGIRVVRSGPGWLELALPDVAEHAVIIALPYPSEARLDEALAESLDEELLQQAYSAKVGRIFQELAGQFRPDTVNLALSHLFVMGGEGSDSERPIQLGGALTVTPDQLPGDAHYVALGHLHKPQRAPGFKGAAYYAGSLLQYSFSESGCQKAVFLIEARPEAPAAVEKVPLASGRPLVRWVAKEGVAEAVAWCQSGRDPGAWIDLEIWVDGPLSQEEIKTLRNARPELIGIRPVIVNPADPAGAEESRLAKPLPELFAGFYQARTGVPPKPELLDYFLEIAAGDPGRAEERSAGGEPDATA
ncbi:exodeoxyribonuclease I subunit D [Hydrogenispora ethanolica]|uniref:Nuclease SbcCD subunit D n=1 Tax=Hydrogenispora ethanolica TaxID=1082276 RepID=A0A4V2QGS1_HYDET|nr:exonuclease subunit SbcD [Hydrogenispora ethanolica]TCL76867.1 exodeoxyribonuclease I subunit D [Hydrogenispora ethanolica]